MAESKKKKFDEFAKQYSETKIPRDNKPKKANYTHEPRPWGDKK